MALPMALPVVKTLKDCASFSHTVTPFLPQLTSLPARLLQSWSSLAELREIYLTTNPLVTALAFSLAITPIFLVLSEINKNYSQVDRMWSILPTMYNTHFVIWAHMMGLPSHKLDTLLAFSGIWSCRLTFNYWRKGGYSIGSEDYRWAILRQKISPPLFFIFNVIFISLAQSLLLLSITAPTYVILLSSRVTGDDHDIGDLIFTRAMVGLVLLEWFADQQQWDFQNAKKDYQKTAKAPKRYTAEDLDRGFLASGLWAWSRHPNFAAEQTIWALLYQWSCYSTDVYYNWTIGGALSYLILFQASTWFTELVSAQKYPEYREYQLRVGKFLPKMSTEIVGEADRALKEQVGDVVEKENEDVGEEEGEEEEDGEPQKVVASGKGKGRGKKGEGRKDK